MYRPALRFGKDACQTIPSETLNLSCCTIAHSDRIGLLPTDLERLLLRVCFVGGSSDHHVISRSDASQHDVAGRACGANSDLCVGTHAAGTVKYSKSGEEDKKLSRQRP